MAPKVAIVIYSMYGHIAKSQLMIIDDVLCPCTNIVQWLRP